MAILRGEGRSERWRERFERDGAIEIYTSRLRTGWAMLALGLLCTAIAAYMLFTPAAAGYLPLGVLRVGGVISALGRWLWSRSASGC